MADITPIKSGTNNFSLPFLEDKIDLRSLVYFFWEEKLIILAMTFLTVLMGFYFAITKVPEYRASVLIQVEKNAIGGGLLAGADFGALNKSSSPADVQTALIKSRYILMPTIESLGWDISVQPNRYAVIGNWYARHHSTKLQAPLLPWLNKYGWGGESLSIKQMHVPPANQGKKYKLVAGEDNTYQLFTPTGVRILTAKVGQLAVIKPDNEAPTTILVDKLLANPGMEFFISKASTENIADSIATRLQITDLGQSYQLDKTGILQVALVGTDPESIVTLLNAIADSAVQKDTERKSIEAAKTLKFMESQLPVMKASLNATEVKLNQHRMQSGTIDITLKTRLILKQIADVQKEIEKVHLASIVLLQQLTPEHPTIIALKGKKAALEEELSSLEKQLQRLPASDQTSSNLIRDIKVKTQLYLMMLHKIQELKVIKAGTVSEVRILNPATMPSSSLPLGQFTIVLASFLVGIALGSVLVFAKKTFHRYVEDPNWLEQRFGIPTFAIVPYSGEQASNMVAYQDKSEKQLRLLARTMPRDLSIEALRSLRTSLQFALLGARNNIITIMGISPGIGKSFVSANFAHVLADTGKRVLLIDGDIRKGYLHEYFDKLRSPGLSEAMIGEVTLEEAIQKTHLPELDFISTGKFPFNPSELLMSTQFKDTLTTLSSRYDLIVIDTAPILAVTDGAIIGNLASINFLLVAWGKHRAEEIELAMKRLDSNGVKVQGVIVNTTQARAPAQGRYNYNYAYGEN